MKNKVLFQNRLFICSVLIILCLALSVSEKATAYIRPKLFVEQGSPILSTEYPEGVDVFLDSDDFYTYESTKQYYDARGFEDSAVLKDETYANAYTTVFPSLTLKAELGDLDNAIKSFVIKGSAIYICQEYDTIDFNGSNYTGPNVLLSKCKINGDSFSRQDSMLLTNVGSASTLEIYKYDGETYFLIGCGSLEQGENVFFSTELGRIKYTPGAVIDSKEITRLTTFSAEDENDSVKYVESALSSDKKKILVHQRSFLGKDSFFIYDFTVVNDLLSSSKTKEVHVSGNKRLEKALLKTFDDPTDMPVSVKGIELSNEKNGISSIYLSAGDDSFDNRLLKLYRYDSQGKLKGELVVSDLGLNVAWGEDFEYYRSSEINGLRIKGKSLQFAFRDLNNNKHQLILSVQKKTMKTEGHVHDSQEPEGREILSEVKYSLKNGTLIISGNGPMDRLFTGNSEIKKVVIEDGITEIPENAFYGCSNLTGVILPNKGLRRIESGAFAYTSLKEISIPESVSVLGYGALYSSTLKSITLPSNQVVYTATGKASENYPRTIGTGKGCTIKFRYNPEDTNVTGYLVAEEIIFGM